MRVLMNYVGSENPVFSQPFTVVDPKGVVWSVSTDRIWFVAAKGKNSAPRFRGDMASLGVILNLLKLEPKDPVVFDREEVLQRLDPEGLGAILGVVVSLKKLHDLLSLPEPKLQAWDATEAVGAPSVGFSSERWRAYLMGFTEVTAPVPEFSLAPSLFFDEG